MVRSVCLSLVIVLAAAPAASAGPKFTSTWKSPDAAGVTFTGSKVAALIINPDDNLRVSGEEALVRELAAVGLTQGIASYRIVPKEELRDPEKAKGWYERSGVQGVVAMRLVSTGTRTQWTPSLWTSPYYSSFWGYYGYGWTSVYDPGYTWTDTVVVIETLVFSVPKNALLWAGVTESTNPKDAGRLIKEVVAGTVKEMTKQGLVRKK